MGLWPGKAATDMQKTLLQSEQGLDARFDHVQHVPPDWPGQDVSLRDTALRVKLGFK